MIEVPDSMFVCMFRGAVVHDGYSYYSSLLDYWIRFVSLLAQDLLHSLGKYDTS
jgi:hypothetical protein